MQSWRKCKYLLLIHFTVLVYFLECIKQQNFTDILHICKNRVHRIFFIKNMYYILTRCGSLITCEKSNISQIGRNRNKASLPRMCNNLKWCIPVSWRTFIRENNSINKFIRKTHIFHQIFKLTTEVRNKKKTVLRIRFKRKWEKNNVNVEFVQHKM